MGFALLSQFVSPAAQAVESPPILVARHYRCHCGQPVFFRNSQCLTCNTPLGYDPARGVLLPLISGPQADTWLAWPAAPVKAGRTRRPRSPKGLAAAQALAVVEARALAENATAETPVYKRCLNVATPALCNWLLPANDPQALCPACRLNHTTPDLNNPDQPDNGELWGRVEMAKRRMVSSLILLRLPVASRVNEDPERGLMFDFLRACGDQPHVMTGHDTGLITINLEEADDAKREAVRKAMREPYRTLLGHFRHEVGHYYWDRLVNGTPWLDGFHQLFGDETQDYAASLKRSYEQGPPADWPQHFVSAYASTHPWEDWAECWAHYLHMRDGIDTAQSLGLGLARLDLEFTPFKAGDLYLPNDPGAAQFLAILNHWTRLSTLLNEMSRSMGQIDFYPFALPRQVVGKLQFIHLVVTSLSWLQTPQPAEAPPVLPVPQALAPPPQPELQPPPLAPQLEPALNGQTQQA